MPLPGSVDRLVVSLAMALVPFGLAGVYAYREATRAERTSPARRGLIWWVLGLVGALSYLVHVRERGTSKLGWIVLAAVLVAVWAVEPVLQHEPAGLRAWAAFVAGLLVLYWQFDLRAVD